MKIGQRFKPHRLFTGVFIPDAIYGHPNLTATAKLIYGRLAKFQGERGEAYPAGTTLAEELGISERQAFEHLGNLVDEKLIEREPRKGTSTVYHFLWHECLEDTPKVVRKTALQENTGSAENRTTGSAENRTGGSAEFRIRSESVEYESIETESITPKPPFSQEPKNQNLPTPEDSLEQEIPLPPVPDAPPSEPASLHHAGVGDIDDKAPIETFVQNLLRRQGVRWKTNIRAAEPWIERLHSDEREAGHLMRYALLAMEADKGIDWKKLDLPIAYVLKRWRQYDQIPLRRKPEAAYSNAQAGVEPEHPPTQPTSLERDCGAFLEIWNSVVPEALRQENPGRLWPELSVAMKDPEFRDSARQIAEKAKLLVEHGNGKVSGVNLAWLFRTAKGKPVWWQLLKDFYLFGVEEQYRNGNQRRNDGASRMLATALDLLA